MANGNSEFIPMRKDLLMRELQDEVILYDRETRKAHCLNHTAAAIWRLCDGTKSVKEIAYALEQDSTAPMDEGVVWMAVHHFDTSGLLQNKISAQSTLSRRDLMKKIGIGAAMVLPITASIAVPAPAAAVSPARPRRSQRRR
jgi:hypothetical protein